MNDYIEEVLGLQPITLQQVVEIVRETGLDPKSPIDLQALGEDLTANRSLVWLFAQGRSAGTNKSFAREVGKQSRKLLTILSDKKHSGTALTLVEHAFEDDIIQGYDNRMIVLFILHSLAKTANEMVNTFNPIQGKQARISVVAALSGYLVPLYRRHWGKKATVSRNQYGENPGQPVGPAINFLLSAVRITKFLPNLAAITRETAVKAIYLDRARPQNLDEFWKNWKIPNNNTVKS